MTTQHDESAQAWPMDSFPTGTTPTHYELKQQLISNIRDNDIEHLKATLNTFKKKERKQLVDTPRCLIDDLSTLLMHAVYHGRTEIVRYLIDDCECDVNIKNMADWTALMFAAFKGHTGIIETLLEAGAEIDAINSFGSTALHIVTDKGLEEVVKKLLDCGADTTIKDNACWTALEISKYNNFQSISNLLQNKMPLCFLIDEDLLQSVRIDDVLNFKKVFEENFSSIVLDSLFDGTVSWLMCASHHGGEEIVKFLLELKCNVNLKSSAGWTALMFAANAGHKHVVKLLLHAMSDIDATNRLGSTALHLAIDKGHVNVIKQLLGHHARTDIEDSAGLTALQLPGKSDACEVAKKMISTMITTNYMSTAFCPVAELIDFAYNYKASSLQIDKTDIKHKPCLSFVYDELDIDQEALSRIFLPKMRDILRYLGNDVLMFTKSNGFLEVTYLSKAILMATDVKNLVPPIVKYGLPELSCGNNFDIGRLKSILKNPIFKTEDELKKELKRFGESPSTKRAMIKIYNITKLEVDSTDILCSKTSSGNIKSLREFCRILYLKHQVKIVLQGIEVNSIIDVDYLNDSQNFKCNLKEETSLDITFGFIKDKEKTEARGVMIYHRNRLVKIKKVQNAEQLVGAANIDFLTCTPHKHDFIKDDMYRQTMRALTRTKKLYLKLQSKREFQPLFGPTEQKQWSMQFKNPTDEDIHNQDSILLDTFSSSSTESCCKALSDSRQA